MFVVYVSGPRAGINFLDGFGGGNLVESNALWNWVRETGASCSREMYVRVCLLAAGNCMLIYHNNAGAQ